MSATEVRPESPAAPTASYRAAVVKSFGDPLVVEQVERLALEPGQIRVKVEAAGLCHTDIHAAHGDWPVKPSPPFVPGHEGVGIVVELGPGVDRASRSATGSRCRGSATPAAPATTASPAGRRCASQQENMGYSIDGGFGEYAIAYARYVVQGAGQASTRSTRRRSPAPA